MAPPAESDSEYYGVRDSSHDDSDSESGVDRADESESASESVVSIHLPSSTIVNPRSSFKNFTPPLPVTRESRAVQALSALQPDDEKYFDLEDFEIYYHSKDEPLRLRALHFLGAGQYNNNRMFFDGVLSVGSTRFYVQHVPFAETPVSGYGSDVDAVDKIWIRSELNENREIYYRLRRPSPTYKRFYTPYLWVATLGKHVVDFCDEMLDKGRDVQLSHFRGHFARWLHQTHPHSQAVQAWHGQFREETDFRTAITAYSSYLWKEICSILGEEHSRKFGWYREVTCQFYKDWTPKADPDSRVQMKNVIMMTVVTPYNYKLFSGLAIGKYLTSIPPRDAPPDILSQCRTSFLSGRSREVDNIRPGDVISTMEDGKQTGTKWKSSLSTQWYGLVHQVSRDHAGAKVFDVAWLYRPDDTPCRSMHYPWPNELFMSDHCTCEEDETMNVKESEVTGVHTVEWFGGPDTAADFFIRQTYLSQEKQWVQLSANHVFCKMCQLAETENLRAKFSAAQGVTSQSKKFKAGETVLAVFSDNDQLSEPFVVDSTATNEVRLRRLLRRCNVDSNGTCNELVYTDKFVTLPLSNVISRCTIRAFIAGTAIPSPYNRGGTGNLFYLTHYLDERGNCVPLDAAALKRLSFSQGFDPNKKHQKLRALDLFCGCGNLGRGLEDSGIIETHWANDIWTNAIHTLMANSHTDMEPFLGPADVFLARALKGKFSQAVPKPGDVDLISGGSPCQGFSALTTNKNAPQQFKNRSMIASFASMVDYYRPKYGVLENVPNMVRGKFTDVPGKMHTEDIFGQLVCAIVGLGYQLSIVLGNAWDHGAPQQRQRVFLVFSAPGYAPPRVPIPSHGLLPSSYARRSMGMLSNGEHISEVWDGPTAFPFLTIGKATTDLNGDDDKIHDGIVDICVPHPDHRTVGGSADNIHKQISYIARFPYSMNLPKTIIQRGDSARSLLWLFTERQLKQPITSNAFKRVNPEGLLPTVTTSCSVADGWTGSIVHWKDHRPLSILEVRRAQGIPDHEVLIGEPKHQWKLVGNAVSRQMALAIGLSVRESWLGSLYEDDGHGERTLSSSFSSVSNFPILTKVATTTNPPPPTSPPCRPKSSSASVTSSARLNRVFRTDVRRSSTASSVTNEVVSEWRAEVAAADGTAEPHASDMRRNSQGSQSSQSIQSQKRKRLYSLASDTRLKRSRDVSNNDSDSDSTVGTD